MASIADLMMQGVAPDDPAAAPAPAATPPSLSSMMMDDATKPYTPPAAKSTKGAGTDYMAALNKGLADLAGAPADLATWALNKIPGVNIEHPIGGSEDYAKTMGAAGIDTEPTPGTLATAAGEGTAGMVGFEGLIRSGAHKAAEAIPYVGKLASRAGDMIESALGPGKVSSTLAAGAAGASGGAGGQALEDTVPEDSPWRSTLNVIGNIAGGAPVAGLELGAKKGVDLLGQIWKREVSPFFASGQKRMAADIVKQGMSDPGAATAALDDPSLTNLTTYQKTGDPKLGQLERWAATERPEDFKTVNAQQNEQRVAHINALASEGQPAAVGEFFGQQLRALDDLGQQAEDVTAAHLANTRGAQADALTDVGGTRHPNAEGYGAEQRETVQGLADTEKARVSGLWDAAVGDGNLSFYTQPLKQMSADLQASVRPTQRPPTGEEKSIYDAIDALPDDAPFLGAKDLRSRISAEIRQQIRARGTTEAEEVARLLQAKNGLDEALQDSITAQAAREQQSVSEGILNPEEAMYRRLLAEAENYKLGENVQPDGTATARSGAGAGRDAGISTPSPADDLGAAVSPGGGSRGPAGGAGAAEEAPPQLTQQKLDEYARARQGTFDYKRTYRSGPVGDVLAPGPNGYKLGNGAVAAKFFNGSDTSPAALDALIAAHGGDRAAALRTISDYAAFDMRRVAAPNGVVNPAKLASWMTKHQAALSAVPELRAGFSTLERATATMQAAEAHTVEAAQLHRQVMHEFETSAAKHFLGRDPDIAVAGAFKSANPAQTFRDLVRMAAEDRSGAATEGLRRSVVEHILKTYSSSAEAGGTGVAQLKFDGLSKFIGKQEGAIRAVLGDDGYKNLQDVVADMQKANRSVSGTKLPGGSNTPQDMAGHRRFGKLTTLLEHLATEAGGAAAGMHFAGPIGGIMGFFAGRAFSSARKGAMKAVTDLVVDAMLDPRVAKELLRHVSPQQVKSGAVGQFYSRLVGLAAPKPFAAGGRTFPPGFAGGGLAGQTLVDVPGPTDIDGGPDDYTAGVPPMFRDKVGQAKADEFWDKAGPQGSLDAISNFGHEQKAADDANMRIFHAKQAGQQPEPADWEAVQNSPMMNFGLGLSAPTPKVGGLAAGEALSAPGGLASTAAHDTGAPYGQAPEPLAAPAGSAAQADPGSIPGGRGELPRSPGGMGPQDRPASAAPIALEGLPAKVKIHNDRELPDWMGGQREFQAGPNVTARKVATDYMAKTGLDAPQPTKYLTVDPERGARIAQAFDEMKHDPSDPLVKGAYEAMAKETMAQWKAIKKTGLKTEFIKPGDPDPYHASPRLAAEDVRRNNHLYVFPTDSGYGVTGITPEAIAENPLLAATKEKIGGQPARMNDIFRVVHDYFGHVKEGVGFRADGEENAWNSHARMYSPLARLAMTSETRGQNSWVNWGPHGEGNRGASSPDTVYADQKIGILPDWAMNEGAEGVAPVNTADMRKMLAGPRNPLRDTKSNTAEDLMARRVGLPKGDKIRDALEDAKAAVANSPDTGLFDLRRDTLAQTPDVPQRELPRYEPQHGVSPRMTDMMNRDDVREQMLGGIGAGVEQGSAGWYNTDQMRQAFKNELGEHGDAAYKRFLDYVSGASPRSNVIDNIRNASFQHYLEQQGHHPNDVNPFPYPYGHLAQNLHRMNAAKIRGGGYNLFDNPKPPSFSENLAGNWHPGTMDAHAMRAVGMLSQDPRFLANNLRIPIGKDLSGTEQFQNVYPKRMFERGEIDMPKALATPGYWSSRPNDNEYKALEGYFRGLGREYELDTAPTQAAAWTGHGKMTGLGTEPLPFMALFDKVLNRTAYARGEEPKETLRRFIRGEAPLYEEGGTVHENGLASAGEPVPGGLASGGRALKAAFHEVYHDTPAIVKHTAKKFGAEDARKQRIAIALSKARKAGADV